MEGVLKGLMVGSDVYDVKFVVGGVKKEFFAHRVLLQATSPLWKNLFYPEGWQNEKRELKTIVYEKYEPEIFQVVMEYVYLRQPTLTDVNCMRVQETADALDIKGLGAAAMLFMTKNISVKNCFDILRKAVHYQDSALESKVADFLQTTKGAFDEPRFLVGLTEELVIKSIKMKRISSNEIMIFRRVKEWAEDVKAKTSSPQPVSEIAKNVLPYISMAYFATTQLKEVMESGLVPKNVIFENSLELIKRYRGTAFKVSRGISGISIDKIKVLHLSSNTDNWVEDEKLSILSSGIDPKNYAFVDPKDSTPSLLTLKNYHVVWLSSTNNFQNPQELGDILNDYVVAGGSVVVAAVHSLRNDSAGWVLKGRFISEGLSPIKNGENLQGQRCTLGDVQEDGHYIMKGVKTFDGGKFSSHLKCELNEGGLSIAKWSDGEVLVAEKIKNENYGAVVVLNIRPASSKVKPTWWDVTTDGRKLIANSIVYGARQAKLKLD